jgi:16S rRNA (cytidine1402-2'-O)-methyltransferase
MKGILYIVAVPIGNSKDITYHAVEIFGQVDIIACEHTGKFLDLKRRVGFETRAALMAYYSYNEAHSSDGLIKQLNEGKNIAMVTDAGTPRISDPGYHIVRKAHEAGIQVKAVPGASAVAAGMSIAPIPLEPLLYLGFISPKPGRRDKTLALYEDFKGTVCFYESVHRLIKLLTAVHNLWGNAETFIVRELTKQHEETFWGPLEKAIEWAEKKRGEFIVYIHKK